MPGATVSSVVAAVALLAATFRAPGWETLSSFLQGVELPKDLDISSPECFAKVVCEECPACSLDLRLLVLAFGLGGAFFGGIACILWARSAGALRLRVEHLDKKARLFAQAQSEAIRWKRLASQTL